MSTPHLGCLYEFLPAPESPAAAEVLALEAAGCRVTLVALRGPRTVVRGEPACGWRAEVIHPPSPAVRELPLRFPPDDPGWQAMAARAPEEAAAAWYFAGALQRRGVQQVHVPGGVPALHTALLMRSAGLPFSFTADAEIQEAALLLPSLAAADLILAPSESVATALRVMAPEAAARVQTIPPGLDASRYPAALCGGPGVLRVLYSPGENGSHAIHAAAEQLHARGIEMELTILDRSSVSDAARKRLLAVSDVYVHAGGGTTGLLEAMAAGLPVLGVSGSDRECIEDERTGWLLPVADPGALTERLALLADDPALRSAAGHAGLERVLSSYSLGRRAARLTGEFRRLLEGRFAPAGVVRPASVLCLMESWPPDAGDQVLTSELRFLAGQPGVELLAARVSHPDSPPPAGMEFLPDAAVIEQTWQQESALAEKALALRAVCPSVDGEDFLLHARRAVYLATLASVRGWSHVHALRSGMLLTVWFLRRLCGLTASAAIEPGSPLPAAALPALAAAFAFGSSPAPGAIAPFEDLLHPAPPAPRRRGLFSSPAPLPPSVDVPAIWRRWLQLARPAAG
jgi:Glycosyltransferase Family 4/Glycosyl transferases group 1